MAQVAVEVGGALPDAVLFNGGTLAARPLRQRILDVLTDWRGGARPAVIEDQAPELAVARGAAYYGLVRAGRGVRVGGGAPPGSSRRSHERRLGPASPAASKRSES